MDLRNQLTAADAEPPTPDVDRRAFELGRLKTYREVLKRSLSAVAHPDVPPTWDALKGVAPEVAPQVWLRVAQSEAEDAELDEDLLGTTVFQTRMIAESAIGPAEAAERTRALAKQQSRRITGLLAGTLAAIAVVVLVLRWTTPSDLAKGKPWRTSSAWTTCEPARGRCGPAVTRILFHTNDDENPWFLIDLEKPTKFSSVTVVNRRDGGLKDRAVPLVLEVGDDGVTWRPLATQAEVFSTWNPRFATQTARYVRLRVARKTFLHLESVSVHP